MSEDLISRKAAIDAIWDGTNMDIYTREVKEILEGLPSAPPVCIAKVTFDKAEMEKIIEDLMNERLSNSQQRTGQWIFTENNSWVCSRCGQNPTRGMGIVPSVDGMRIQWKYCNRCGAKMEVREWGAEP